MSNSLSLFFYFSPDSLPEWLNDYPVTIIQFLFFLYHNFTDFMQVFMSAEVLGALAGTLFPKSPSTSQDSSGASSPADEVVITHAKKQSIRNIFLIN